MLIACELTAHNIKMDLAISQERDRLPHMKEVWHYKVLIGRIF